MTRTTLILPLLFSLACGDGGSESDSSAEGTAETAETEDEVGESGTSSTDDADTTVDEASTDEASTDEAESTDDAESTDEAESTDGTDDATTDTSDGTTEDTTDGTTDGTSDDTTDTDTTDGTETGGDVCAPAPEDSECTACLKENCCEEFDACFADAGCACVADCVAEGGQQVACFQMCGVMGLNPAIQDYLGCSTQACNQEC